jgi:hypothetical protein
MAVDPVTPIPGLNHVVAIGGAPVEVAAGGNNGGFIVNPASATDQGIAGIPESLFVDPTGGEPGTAAFGTTFEIAPGDSWQIIPGQTTPTNVNAATGGHRFSVVLY